MDREEKEVTITADLKRSEGFVSNAYQDSEGFWTIGYGRLIDKRLGVMDVAAVDMCQRSGIPIIVLNLRKEGNMRDVVLGRGQGTIIDAG